MKLRLAVSTVVVAAAVLLLGGVCGRRLYPPEFIEAPNSVYAGDSAYVRLAASGRGYESVRYVVNWGDATVDTSEPYSLNDAATMWHVWTEAGTRQIRAAVYSPDDTLGIRWAAQRSVDVEAGGDHAPVIDTVLLNQGVAVKGASALFTVKAYDPDGDSLRLKFDWGEAESTTAYLASPCSVTLSHVFTQVDTTAVVISAQDAAGATSVPDTVFVPVGLSGGVKWYWQSPEQGIFNTSPLCLFDMRDECIYAGSYTDEAFYSLIARNGKTKYLAHPFLSPYVFTGPAAFCRATQHFIVGSEEGELYALGLDLGRAWRWPNAPSETLEPMVLFGAPAIRDNRLYVPRDDDSLYYFIDSIDHGVRVATFPAGAGIVDAPVIDAQGDVYFGTDSGYLYKVGPELDTMIWRTRLIADGEIHSPIVGSGGKIYCTSESSRIYAIDAAIGVPLWTMATDGEPRRLALGQTAIFVGTDLGVVYSIDPATGAVNWQKSLAQGSQFMTAPIVTANGCVYLQDENDVLYCLYQLDGALIWACDCDRYLPGGATPRPKKTGFPHYDPDPTITSTGDVIVPGQSAVFCVAGYPEGPLDPLAPWPKWQHDLYNSGYVGGGR